MSFDTSSENKRRQNLSQYEDIWVFGYGSLIYKVDFAILEKRPASIKGWQRRFWQGSHDHRGTPDSPGRVLTLIQAENAVCFGMAYRVESDVFEHLDQREKNGYLRYEVEIVFDHGSNLVTEDIERKRGLVYIGSEASEAYFGSASIEDIATQIHQSVGPSGRNDEYVFLLAKGLRELGEHDEHVFAIEAALKKMV
jgi:cation transport protein ChaC